MSLNITQKVIKNHLVSGEMKAGAKLSLKIDQTLTQDATGTMAYLQFEALEVSRVNTELSVSYIDHNMLQSGFMNADDHAYLQSIAAKYGIYLSKPGNGICHQVHLERFGIPGKTLVGSDSHTPTAGGIGMLAMGVGGLDVALAMAGKPFFVTMPKVVGVSLKGKLSPFVSAKDIILELLRRLTVKGGVGKVFEFTGPGIETLSVPERATITNMGAELGATTSIFPSDEITRLFMRIQKREYQWVELKADDNAKYDEKIEIDLTKLEPLIAQPHMPDQVVKVKDLAGKKVNQVVIGSCTNSSYKDISAAAQMLEGKKVHKEVSVGLLPGSKQVLAKLAETGELNILLFAGVRILESSCGACIGMGFSPGTDAVSLRTFNRNFLGRSGTKSAGVFLCSPQVAVAAALKGEITDPRTLGLEEPYYDPEEELEIDDSLILAPAAEPETVKIQRGPNISPLPEFTALPLKLTAPVLLKLEDNITTDHIMPAGAKILPLRSNVPKISEHVFEVVDHTFSKRALAAGVGIIVGGENYGQGSSREHAALAPRYLGVRAVLVKSFARIHLANLVNFGILPIIFERTSDYETIEQNDKLEFDLTNIRKGKIKVFNQTKQKEYKVKHPLADREIEIVMAGGMLAYTKNN
ncbi:aconitate hydratase [bacterium]|jgi:aconitate hydratase|nr:aconitate hydratase [bacterium]MBT3581896.1 aconitate hydratase [bacterium]MBT4552714.1 aconitate hydratase [bacterium]MBT7087364.1 aconitate hydratase [bacterium]